MIHSGRYFAQFRALAAAALLASCGSDGLVLPEEGIPTAIVIAGGDGQPGTVGAPLPAPLTVRVLDSKGRPVQGQEVTFSVVGGGGAVTPAKDTTDASGEARTSWTLGGAAGAQRVEAEATGGAAPDDLDVMFSATAGASAASELELVSGNEQTATAGSTLADSLVVRATDSEGNPVAGVTVTWTATGGGTVSEVSTVTGADGRAGVKRTLGTAAGAQATVAASAGLEGSPITFTAIAAVGSAGKLVVEQQPSSSASSGTPFERQPRVQIQDANGNNVLGAGRAISAEIASGPAGATLSGSATVSTNAGGMAVFTNLSITGPAGAYTLNFTGANLTGATSSSITLAAGAATRLAFTLQPSNTVAGAAIAPPPRVAIQDALGQTVTSANNEITITIGANPGGGTLTGPRTATAVNGVATFPNLKINNAGSGYTLTASASGLAGGTSTTFNVTVGGAATISANSSVPSSTVAGGTVAPDPSVKVSDASGNPVAGVNVTFAVVGSGSVSGETQTTNAQGIATVGSWTIGTAAGTRYELRATAAGLAGASVTFSTTATAGSAGQLTIETQPASSGQSGAPLNPQPAVQLRDAAGNPVSQSGIAINATISDGPGGSLTNATRSTNGSGLAVFSGLTITGPSGGYKLNFSGQNISGVESNTITLGSGSATRLGITTQPSNTAENGVAFARQPVVQLLDGSGNPVGADGREVTASIASGGGTLGGDVTVSTNSAGQATFTDLRITGSAGNRTLRFVADGVTPVTSEQIAVTAGPASASQSSITVAPASVQTGSAATVTVTLRDASSNPVSGAGIALTSSSGGSFGNASLTTGSDGRASTTYTPSAAGTHEIQAQTDGFALATTLTATSGPPSETHSSISATPPTVEEGGASTISVTIRDGGSNPVSGATVTLATNSSGSFGSNSLTTDAQGQASTSYTPSALGSHSITAQTGGISLATTVTATTGSPSSSTSSITAAPPALEEGGSSTITVTIRDAASNPIAGATVSLTTDNGGSFANASLTTNEQGQASTTYTPTASGNHLITAQSGGASVSTTVTVSEQEADGSRSSLSVSPPGPIPAGTSADVTVTALTTSSRPLAGATVVLEVSGAENTVVPASRTTDGRGEARFSVGSTRAETKTISARIGGTQISERPSLAVRAAEPDEGQSSLDVSPGSVEAGSTAQVTAVVRDRFGNGVNGASVELSSNRDGAFAATAIVTGANGAVSTSYTPAADSDDDEHRITARAGALTRTATLSVREQTREPDAGRSSVSAESPVDTREWSDVTVTVRDQFGAPMSDISVRLSDSGERGDFEQPNRTDREGRARGEYRNDDAGTYTITATAGSVVLSDRATIEVERRDDDDDEDDDD